MHSLYFNGEEEDRHLLVYLEELIKRVSCVHIGSFYFIFRRGPLEG